MSLNLSARIFAVVVVSLLSTSASWARIGVASVVDGEPRALPPAGTERILHIGNEMQPNEKVTTGANDKAHIVFLDGTSLTVGPNSMLTIDKFIYDPDKKIGDLALTASRGVFRLVGGAISKNSEITIKTPSATMGIRGGIATFAVANNGATTANLLFGQSLTVSTPGGTTTLTQPGTTTQATGGAAPPTPPAPIPPGGLGNNSNFQQSAGAGNQPGGGQGNAPGGSGGGNRPSPISISTAFANSGLSRANSALPPAAALAAVPATQQAQLKTAVVPQTAQAAGMPQVGGPQQGSGSQLAAGFLQGSGPLQGAVPLQGAGPLQGASPLQNAGPLQGAAALQGAGPLQSAGPLQGAAPAQAVGPLPAPGVLPPPAAPAPAPLLAGVPPPPGGTAPGPAGTMNQLLASIMAGPNPPSPQILAVLVNMLTAPPLPPPDAPAPQPVVVANPLPTFVPAPPPQPQPTIPQPVVLPQPVFNTTCQSQVSQSTC